jgi:hypothetical protein
MAGIPQAMRDRLAAATKKVTSPGYVSTTKSYYDNPAPSTATGPSSTVPKAGGVVAPSKPSSTPVASIPQPTTNYGGTNNPYNEILYSKKQYDAGNKAWAQNNATQFYNQLDPDEAAKIKGMNTQQLEAYINSRNTSKPTTGQNIPPVITSPAGPIPQPSQSSQPSYQPAPTPTPYKPSYTGPDIAGMTKNINDQYSNALAAELQKLRDARDRALQGYAAQETQAKQSAYDNRNQADTVNLQNQQAMKETMANAGLTTDGQNLTLQAAENAQRLGDLGQINRQEANALQDISGQRSLLQNNEAANELALQQQIDSEKAAALFDLAKYGDQQSFNVDQSQYGRYRDDINQQFAQDQFDWNKYQQGIQNDAQYGGVYNGNPTYQAQQQQIQNDAQYGGTYNGQKTADQSQREWENRFNYGQAIGQFGNGQKTLENQNMQNQNNQWQQTFDRNKYESDRAYQNQVQQQAIANGQWQKQFDQDVKRLGFDQASQLWSQAFQENQANQDDSYRKQQLQQNLTDSDRSAASQATSDIVKSGLISIASDPYTGEQSVSVPNPQNLANYILALNLSDNATDALLYQFGLDNYVKK